MPDPIRMVCDLREQLPAVAAWPEGVTLVPFSAANAPAVHALMRLAYAGGGGSVPAAFDSWWAATRHDAEFDASLCFVAAHGDDPVGFVLCWTSSFVKDVVVHPDWQRRGIASALLLAALRALAYRGQRETTLKVHADNAPAQSLYARLGFRPPGLPSP